MTEDEMVGWHHSSMDMSLSKLWEIVKDGKPGVLQSMGSQRIGQKKKKDPCKLQGILSSILAGFKV